MTENPDAASALAVVLLVFWIWVLAVVVIAVISYVALGLTLSRFFRKVGVQPWIAWVPFYNHWKWMEVGGHPGWIALLSLLPYGSTVSAVFLAIGMYRTGRAFRKDGSWVVLGIFLPWVWCALLGRDSETYDPALIVASGYPPPRAGFGSIPPGAPWPPPPPPLAAAGLSQANELRQHPAT